LKHIKHHILHDETLADVFKTHGVKVMEIEDLSGRVPHVGAGGAWKSSYVSPKSGKTIYVLERQGCGDGESYVNHVWQFEADFTPDEARMFLEDWDEALREPEYMGPDGYV
jgi:hypothetical protein